MRPHDTTPNRSPRVNLLRAHGSPSCRLYYTGCRCTACKAGKRARAKRYNDAHAEENRARSSAWYHADKDRAHEQNARYYRENRDKLRAKQVAYRAEHVDDYRRWSREWYERNRELAIERQRVRYEENRAAIAEQNHRRYLRDRARVAEYGRAYYQSHKEEYLVHSRRRRARKRAVPGHHTAADVAAQLKRQCGKCYYGRDVNPSCAVSLKHGYHVDHVVPLAGERASSNGPENLVLACPSCNLRKGASDPMDFAGRLF